MLTPLEIHKWTKPLVVIYPVTKVVCWYIHRLDSAYYQLKH